MSGYRTKKMATPWSNRVIDSSHNALPRQSQVSSLALESVYIAEMAEEKIFAGPSSRLHNESLIGELHSPKSRLRRALEVGRNAISVLRELGDIALSEPPAPMAAPVSEIEATALAHQPTAEVGTPTRASALLQARLASNGGSAGRSGARIRTPLRRQTPLRSDDGGNDGAGPSNVTHNTSSVNSDSPVVMRSPLHASTPTSAARRLRQSKLANNSMDDSEFNLLLTAAIGMAGDNDAPFAAPPKADSVAEPPLIEEDLPPQPTSHRRSQRLMNDSMDDSFMNALLCSQACTSASKTSADVLAAATSARRATPPKRTAAPVPEEDDDEIVIVEQPKPTTSAAAVDVKPPPPLGAARPVLVPKLTRHSSHTGEATMLMTSPTSSRPGRTVEMATRMRRHRSLIDEMKACNTVKQEADPVPQSGRTTEPVGQPPARLSSVTAVAKPPSRPSPAFNSTLLKPSTLQRYMDRTMQQTLPGGHPKPPHASAVQSRVQAVPSKMDSGMDQEWMSKRASQSFANVRPSPRTRTRPLGAIENNAAAPSPASRKRSSNDAGPTTTRLVGQPAAALPLKRPMLPLYDEVENVVIVDEPLGTTVTAPTAGGFISKRLASQMVGVASPTAAVVANPSRYVPPKDDSFYDDDIEFLV